MTTLASKNPSLTQPRCLRRKFPSGVRATAPLFFGLLCLSATACDVETPDIEDDSDDAEQSLETLDAQLDDGYQASTEAPSPSVQLEVTDSARDLAIGDDGEDVRKVHEYLAAYGYFPNEELRKKYPRWRPVVPNEVHDIEVFDEFTEQAVFAYQRLMNLEVTGVVDEPTRRSMQSPRCMHPDSAPLTNREQTSYWDVSATPWGNARTIRYFISNFPPTSWMSNANFINGINDGAQSWEDASDFNIIRTTNPSLANFTVTTSFDPTTGFGASFNNGVMWFNQTNDVNNRFADWAAHEMGHMLGLTHSNIIGATMDPRVAVGAETVERDDIIPFELAYNSWDNVPGAARDVGIGANGAVWVVGTGNDIWRALPGGGWSGVGAVASRIAVEDDGSPWVVQNSGLIFRRTGVRSWRPNGLGWDHVPGLAQDIGIGDDQVWVIDKSVTAPGGFAIWHYNGSGWDPVPGGGVRIAVGRDGDPWVVNDVGDVWRRTGVTTSNRLGTGWQLMPGARATDIAVGADANDNVTGTAWAISDTPEPGGFGVVIWNEQTTDCCFGPDPRARFTWVDAPGAGTNIAVGPDGRPWVINDGLQIWRWPDMGN